MTARLLQSLPSMSLAISVVVIICMAVSFAALFFLYGKTKSKSIDFGVEDASLKRQLSDRLNKREEKTSYKQMLSAERKKERSVQIVTDVILAVVLAFVAGLTIFSFVLRGKGEQIYFGDTAYLTVLTSSMQEKNDNNAYLQAHDDGVRIHQYALIGVDKADPASLKAGDIIAFKYEGNTIYVHRIVSVRESDGGRLFTTMGDANDLSLLNETDISADRIVGVFNGYHNGYLGVFLIFMRSDIGIVALIFVVLLLAAIDAAEFYITRSYENRQGVLADEMDGERSAAAKEAEAPTERTETHFEISVDECVPDGATGLATADAPFDEADGVADMNYDPDGFYELVYDLSKYDLTEEDIMSLPPRGEAPKEEEPTGEVPAREELKDGAEAPETAAPRKSAPKKSATAKPAAKKSGSSKKSGGGKKDNAEGGND